MQFVDLHPFLMSDRAPEDCMVLPELDGFLTALTVAPTAIDQSEWLPHVWGQKGVLQLDDQREVDEIVGTIMQRKREIREALDTGRKAAFEPIFWTTPEGETLVADWAAGFVVVPQMRPDDWQPLIDDPDGLQALSPILIPCAAEQDDPPEGLDTEQMQDIIKNAPDMIPSSVLEIDQFWRQREKTVWSS